jgi:hypothetical protein
VPGDHAKQDQTVLPAQRAVAAVQAAHPGLLVEESGNATIDRAMSQALGKDFRKAEITSVPVTLILLILVSGALVAAGIPVLLAISAVMTAISLLAIPSRWIPLAPLPRLTQVFRDRVGFPAHPAGNPTRIRWAGSSPQESDWGSRSVSGRATLDLCQLTSQMSAAA